MEYSISKLADLAGISTRTLRYYHEMGLLVPARMNSNGYRLYDQKQVDRLQQILFYRELDVDLKTIQALLEVSHDEIRLLQEHKHQLQNKKKHIEALIATIEATIAHVRGERMMKDNEKFIGFKQEQIKANEEQYGEEIRSQYGHETIDASNTQFLNLTEKEMHDLEILQQQLHDTLRRAVSTRNPGGDLAQETCALHQRWIRYYWNFYSPEAHMALVQMYVDDERFKAYYESIAPGSAEFLRDAMSIFTNMTS